MKCGVVNFMTSKKKLISVGLSVYLIFTPQHGQTKQGASVYTTNNQMVEVAKINVNENAVQHYLCTASSLLKLTNWELKEFHCTYCPLILSDIMNPFGVTETISCFNRLLLCSFSISHTAIKDLWHALCFMFLID